MKNRPRRRPPSWRRPPPRRTPPPVWLTSAPAHVEVTPRPIAGPLSQRPGALSEPAPCSMLYTLQITE
eukprot:6156625-Pyramimonas_sp.AAC.1